MEKNYKRVKLGCYFANLSMSIVGNLTPVLLLTFKDLYGISYSMLGFLVLVNFVTQLVVDLAFSFLSDKFNIPKCVKSIPVLTAVGLAIYAVLPLLFPNHIYICLVAGTIVFASSGGFVEVLISPVIAAIPSKDPDREMSKLHSFYAWGVVGFVVIATLFLTFFGRQNWQYMVLIFTVIPIISILYFIGSKIPEVKTEEKDSPGFSLIKNKGLWLCFFAIFLAGSSECTMAQWSSGYLEKVFGIPKALGDVFGVALFSAFLGLGRTLYSKYGKNIKKVLFLGFAFATLCYVVTALCDIPLIGLVACVLTGFCTSMLWPGNLIFATDKLNNSSVFVFAMMAAGGDLGASIGPQLIGVVTDAVISSGFSDALGMKLGMLVGALFPLVGALIFAFVLKKKKDSKI